MEKTLLAGRTVCIIDDDPLIRRYLSAKLAEHQVTSIEGSTGHELFEIIGRSKIDCILLDYSLAPESGLYIRNQLAERFVNAPPVIMLTATDDQRIIIKAFRSGFSDYLLKKGLRIEDLLTSLNSAIGRRAQEEVLTAEVDRLKRQSVFDELTGLYRREAIDEMIARLTPPEASGERTIAVILIDVNEYPLVLARAGQVAGNRLVRAFASQLQKAARSADICGRFDVSRFVYLIDTDATRPNVDRMVERLAESLSFELDLDVISTHVSAAIGSAVFPVDAGSQAQLIDFAENALNSARSGNIGDADAAYATLPFQGIAFNRDKNRRAERRNRVFKKAKIVMNVHGSLMDCTVRDLSEHGARLRIDGTFPVPESFGLQLAGSGDAKRALRQWQIGNDIGVKF
jgi:diguanylate cyclase (GGDEF)-like protein